MVVARSLALAVLVAAAVGVVVPVPASAVTGAGTDAKKVQTAYVDVAVATLWTDRGIDRPVDQPAVSNPVDMRAWLADMTLEERLWLVGDLETQALYGQQVIVDSESQGWVKIVVPGQPTSRDTRGYPGWLPKGQLTGFATTKGTAAKATVDSGPIAVVRTATGWLYHDEALTEPAMELSFNTRLPVVAEAGAAVRVSTPDDGDRWLAAADVAVYPSGDAIPVPSRADLVADAKRFEGLPYLWAGTSGFGYDCSGFTYTVYKRHGITIPRDAHDQFAAGTPVDRDAMQPGDLLFYARSTGRIHHVGMYLGDGYMIDAPIHTATEESPIAIVKVDEHRYAHEYAGSRRFLPA